jgi:hypothetical protein
MKYSCIKKFETLISNRSYETSSGIGDCGNFFKKQNFNDTSSGGDIY